MAEAVCNEREIVINNLQSKLDILQKNRANVPLEELKTKYATSYKRLLAEIMEAFDRLRKRSLRCIGVYISADKYADIQNVWDEKYKKAVSHAIYKEYNAEKAQALIYEFVNEIICKYAEE